MPGIRRRASRAERDSGEPQCKAVAVECHATDVKRSRTEITAKMKELLMGGASREGEKEKLLKDRQEGKP